MDLDQMKRTVEHLIAHVCDTPFNIKKIALDLNISERDLGGYFENLARAFKLRDLLEHRTGEPALNAISPNGQKITLRPDQLKVYSDFAHLSQNRPIRVKSFSPLLYTLYEEYPQLFEELSGGWKASTAGAYFAEQYISFRKLKLDPGELEFDSLVLELC